ncbi:NADH-quinone oxidoreductase subunit J [Verrucomicrobia bacterium]|nr:NADH-quinone oxidoreductase subunit J [Verrucomicrobiota bacterium]
MQETLFILFSLLTLVFGSLVVASRNPVNSALCLVATIVSMSGLFVLLNAFFLAAVQILVYAGAVMVLFLFVIMLLDLKAEEQKSVRVFSLAAGFLSVGGIVGVFWSALDRGSLGTVFEPATEGGTRELGMLLFQEYVLPFEILSVLLLVAMVGAILLSKKNLK